VSAFPPSHIQLLQQRVWAFRHYAYADWGVDSAIPYLEKFGELGYNEDSFCWSTTAHYMLIAPAPSP
jgi:hypothetical protein